MRARTAPVKRDFTQEHAARLRVVAEKHSLSEIARRTGYPVSCIHSYLNGTRVPAELFSRLAQEFNVNPQWLVSGEGAPYLSDVSPKVASMAQDVLGLVQAMEAVSKMRLGAISGAQPLVRELDDALARHEELQKKLAARSRAVLDKLIEDANDSLAKRNFDATQAQLAAAQRFRKLCDDPFLLIHLKNLEAMLARFLGQPQRALDGYREAFLQTLPVRKEFGKDAYVIAFNYANALQIPGQVREAAAVCDAMLSLGAGDEQMPARAALNFHRGWLDVHLGELHKGLQRMSVALPLVTDRQRERVDAPRYMAAQLFAGLIDFDGAWNNTPESTNKGALLMTFACFNESLEQVERVHEKYFGGDARFLEDSQGRFGGKTLIGHYITAVHLALKGKRGSLAAEYEAAFDSSLVAGDPAYQRFAVAVNACQVARLCGDRAYALRRLDTAEECLKSLPQELTPAPLELAKHHRNALLLDGRSRKSADVARRAREFFRDWTARGYLVFRPIAAAL